MKIAIIKYLSFIDEFIFKINANEIVLLAMADCQAKTDESAEIIILSCTAETLQPQAIEAI